MHLELRHLRTIRAIHQAGGLARAAEMLNMTQSALSHQVKGLEDQAGDRTVRAPVETLEAVGGGDADVARGRADPARDRRRWTRNSARCVRGGPGGCISRSSVTPALTGCFRCWKLSATPGPRSMSISAPGLAFDAMPALIARGGRSGDLLGPRDRCRASSSTPCSTMHPTFVAARQNPLAEKDFIEAEDFRDQVLITYPVEPRQAGCLHRTSDPGQGRAAGAAARSELTAVILMLVGSNRGVAVLPDWVLREVKYRRTM